MNADYVLDYDVVSIEETHRLYLMMRVQAKPATQSVQRRALNLSVVLDRSGSMAGEKLDYVKKATQFLVRHLSKDDMLSVVTYDQMVKVDVPSNAVINKDAISNMVERIQAGGTTNLSGGWLQGCQLVADNLGDDRSNRVLLLTDGLANQGITDHDRLEQMARQKREEGVTTTTMGVGMGFNEDLLRRMAMAGGGAFYFIDNADQAPLIFKEELQDLLNVVGQNLMVALRVQPKVDFVAHLNAYPMDTDGDAIFFRMGDIYADEVKTLLVEITVESLHHQGDQQIGSVTFDYDEVTETGTQHRRQELPIHIKTVSKADFEGQAPNAEVMKAALLLKAARAREDAVKHADKGDFKSASEVLTKAADEIDKSEIEDADLQSQHDMLREEAVDMELGSARYDSYSRKSSVTKSHQSERFMRYSDQTEAMHLRLKQSRQAVERHDVTPTVLRWKKNRIELTRYDIVHIGRSEDSDIVLDEKAVSKNHCQIVREGDVLYLIDLDSKNGTFANGGQLEPNTKFKLSRGDVITVGSSLFRLE